MAKKGAKKSIKISKIKRSNHLRNKLVNRKKLKRNKNAKRVPKPPVSKPNPPVIDENLDEEMVEMMESDDLTFLKNAVTANSYSILENIRAPKPPIRIGQKRNAESNDGLELWFEEELGHSNAKKTMLLLPIKNKDGLVMRCTEINEEEERKKQMEREIRDKLIQEEKEKKKLENRKKKLAKKGVVEEEEGENENEEDDLNIIQEESNQILQGPVTAVDLLACREELIYKKKLEIGLLSAGLLESPEAKIRNFKLLLDILDTEYSEVMLTVRKLAALSLMEVFRDLLPSYVIKHQELRPGLKLKKQTESLQSYERSLLKAYKMYLQSLEKMASCLKRKLGKSASSDPVKEKLGIVAVRCMSELLIRHSYFNFALNIAQALVQFLNNSNSKVREIACEGLRTVLKQDKRGDLSLHVVRRINHYVSAVNHSVHSEVLKVLLALPIKYINIDSDKEEEIKDKVRAAHKKKSLSRRDLKRQKRLYEIEREMLETKTQENQQQKRKNLTGVTTSLFTIFFRVLKRAPHSKLLSVTLEGLAKFAHCINLEYFQDIVNVLDNLLVKEDLKNVDRLHCVDTVFTILSGQGEVLNIDPTRFYTHLYQSLTDVQAGQTHANTSLVLQILEKAVLQRRQKLSLQRLLAFTKRLCTMTPYLLHGAALGYLAVVRTIMMRMKACDVLLDTDVSYGSGMYLPEMPEPEYCGAGMSVLWEVHLLMRHYHPEVRKMALAVLKNDENVLLPGMSKMPPLQLAETYDCSLMVFKPVVPPSQTTSRRILPKNVTLMNDEFASYLESVEESIKFDDIQNWNLLEDSPSSVNR